MVNLVGWREQNKLRRVSNKVLMNLIPRNTTVLHNRGRTLEQEQQRRKKRFQFAEETRLNIVSSNVEPI